MYNIINSFDYASNNSMYSNNNLIQQNSNINNFTDMLITPVSNPNRLIPLDGHPIYNSSEEKEIFLLVVFVFPLQFPII